jgi:hypothetical protein
MQIARIGDGLAEQYSVEIVGGKAANLARMAGLGLPAACIRAPDQPLCGDGKRRSRGYAKSCG